MSTEPICACGRPLHYTSQANRAMVERLVADLGECLKVTVGPRSWMVPRHYLALHGIRAADLPQLAKRLGFEEVLAPEGSA